MRVAFICPSEVRNAIYNKWLGNLFAQYTYIKFDVMEYDEFRKVTDIARKAQENHDGLLLSCYQAYSYAKKRITPKCVWGAVKIRSSAFLRALLEAKQKRYDISNISIDSYTWEEIAQTFEEIGFQITRDSMFLYEPQMAEDDYEQIESIYQFHKKNWL